MVCGLADSGSQPFNYYCLGCLDNNHFLCLCRWYQNGLSHGVMMQTNQIYTLIGTSHAIDLISCVIEGIFVSSVMCEKQNVVYIVNCCV